MAGDNDHTCVERISKGYERYRQIGNKAVTVSEIEMHPIDETHRLVHIGWSSEFEKDGRRIDVPFTMPICLSRMMGR